MDADIRDLIKGPDVGIDDSFTKFRGSEPGAGSGTAWLIFDAGDDLYRYWCYQMTGPDGDHMAESARLVTDLNPAVLAEGRSRRDVTLRAVAA
jgi:hypothetical protein